MSWLSRITDQELVIITGDGSEFRPIWKTASKSRDLKPSRFDFNNIDGTLVKRGRVSSRVIPFELHFQGENNIEEADRFDKATKDIRPWTLRHPLYDEVLVHPASLSINDSSLNVSIATGEFWETIKDTYPDSSIDIQSNVLEAVDKNSVQVAENYGNKLGIPESTTLSNLTNTLNSIADRFRAAAVTNIDVESVENAVSEVFSALDSITSDANVFMTRAAALARTPARFYTDIKTRISTVEASYQDLKLAVSALPTRQNKLWLENMGASLQVAKSEASVLLTSEIGEDQDIESSIKDYETRKDVLSVITDLNNGYNDLLDELGDYQTENDSTPNSYTPSTTSISTLKDSMTKASGQLSQIAIEAKQERRYTLPDNIGIVELVHRLLNTYDSDTIRTFARNNEFKLAWWLQIEKGTEVIYYI